MINQRFGSMAMAMAMAMLAAAACNDDGVDSEEEARAAYLALDGAIAKSLQLGFDGFNAASSANIPPQMTTGDVMGTLTISGQVDQGASDNKGMRLQLAMVDYQDTLPEPNQELMVLYNTQQTAPPNLTLSLRNIPSGTLTGTLMGTFTMSGDLQEDVTLNLTISGMIEPDADGNVRRVAGSTQISGTATSQYGEYQVDVVL